MREEVNFELVTPECLIISQAVYMVVIPGEGGDFGVLPGHIPLLSTIRPGTIVIYGESHKITERIFVEGGFVEVTPERCVVLTEIAKPVASLTLEMATQRAQQANNILSQVKTDKDRHKAERELLIAEAMKIAINEINKNSIRL